MSKKRLLMVIASLFALCLIIGGIVGLSISSSTSSQDELMLLRQELRDMTRELEQIKEDMSNINSRLSDVEWELDKIENQSAYTSDQKQESLIEMERLRNEMVQIAQARLDQAIIVHNAAKAAIAGVRPGDPSYYSLSIRCYQAYREVQVAEQELQKATSR